MKDLKLTAILVAGSLSYSPLAGNQKSTAEKKPNIVFILADDLGWTGLSAYGNKFNESPNIDKLANEGIHFRNYYTACPVSSPTRASL